MSHETYETYLQSSSTSLKNEIGLTVRNLYGPLTPKYWGEKYKIAIYNLESYDPIKEIRRVDIGVFEIGDSYIIRMVYEKPTEQISRELYLEFHKFNMVWEKNDLDKFLTNKNLQFYDYRHR